MTGNKTVSVLGSTGSVGTQALDVARQEGHRVRVLTAGMNYITIQKQALEFHPDFCVLDDKSSADRLRTALDGTGITVLSGIGGLRTALNEAPADVTVNSVSGAAGLVPTLEVLKTDTRLALANKESLVMAGDMIMREAAAKGKKILPVDSEHCAIFQCLEGRGGNKPKTLLLTASGGPFFGMTPDELEYITVDEALAHPTWKMGRKITIDSATLMNKGFEVIEAARLFGVGADDIRVVVHRESIIHSMVEYADNSILAQLSVPDMRLCVQYAVNYPERCEAVIPRLSLEEIGSLRFAKPDLVSFPLLGMAYDCLREGAAMPTVLNASNEVAVEAFLGRRIGFGDIPRLVRATLERVAGRTSAGSIDEILHYDSIARQLTQKALA